MAIFVVFSYLDKDFISMVLDYQQENKTWVMSSYKYCHHGTPYSQVKFIPNDTILYVLQTFVIGLLHRSSDQVTLCNS
jgi:hypothetical protein